MLKSVQLHNTHRVESEVSFSCTRILGPKERSRLLPGMWAARPRNRSSIAVGCQPSVFSKKFTPALAPTHLRIQRAPLVLPLAQSGRCMKPTTHVHIVTSLKMELYLHSKIHLQSMHRDNLTVTVMTRLRSLGKMTQMRKIVTPRMFVLFCEDMEGEGGQATTDLQ